MLHCKQSKTTTSHLHNLAPHIGDRRLDLDWIRIGVLSLLIVYHVAMVYVPWVWHVKSPRVQDWLQPAMVLTNPWRLTVLFIVSGAATRFMADKLGAYRLGVDRLRRLFIPIAFSMVVIIPPQTFAQISLDQSSQPLHYGQFWLKYLSSSGNWISNGTALDTPTWNHLWFVVYLLSYTLVLCALLMLLPKACKRLQQWLDKHAQGALLLILPMFFFTFVRLVIAPSFPATHAFVSDWTVHSQSAAAFVFGFLLAKSDHVWDYFAKMRKVTLGTALTGYAIYAVSLAGWISGDITPLVARTVIDMIYGINQWAWVAAIFGFAHVYLSRFDCKARRYLTDAIFPFYIVHQTFIIVVFWMLSNYPLPLLLEAAIIIICTILGCIISYELVRRVTWLRPLFGLKQQMRAVLVR